MDLLDGMFSFVLLDKRDKSFMVTHDDIGICPYTWARVFDGT